VSSAYRLTSTFLTAVGRKKSFTKSENNNGPKIEPWGTPTVTSPLEERKPCTQTCCDLPCRKLCRAPPQTP